MHSQGQPRTEQGHSESLSIVVALVSAFVIPSGRPRRGPAQAANSPKLTTPLPSSSKWCQASSVIAGNESPQCLLIISIDELSSSRLSFPVPSASVQSNKTLRVN